MSRVNNHLNSIGKEIFITYYVDMKNINVNREKLAERMYNENPNANSVGAQITRINLTRKIFERNEQIEALQIIASSKRLPNWVVSKAKDLLYKERSEINLTTIFNETI